MVRVHFSEIGSIYILGNLEFYNIERECGFILSPKPSFLNKS